MANDHRYSDKRTIGRIPPHNDDAEVALLGAVLLRNKVLEDVQTMIVMLIQYVKTFHSRQI